MAYDNRDRGALFKNDHKKRRPRSAMVAATATPAAEWVQGTSSIKRLATTMT